MLSHLPNSHQSPGHDCCTTCNMHQSVTGGFSLGGHCPTYPDCGSAGAVCTYGLILLLFHSASTDTPYARHIERAFACLTCIFVSSYTYISRSSCAISFESCKVAHIRTEIVGLDDNANAGMRQSSFDPEEHTRECPLTSMDCDCVSEALRFLSTNLITG